MIACGGSSPPQLPAVFDIDSGKTNVCVNGFCDDGCECANGFACSNVCGGMKACLAEGYITTTDGCPTANSCQTACDGTKECRPPGTLYNGCLIGQVCRNMLCYLKDAG